MSLLSRPHQQPIHAKLVLFFFIVLSMVLAVTAGYYHQRWQNQVRRTTRVQTQLDAAEAKLERMEIDPSDSNQ